MPRKYRRPFLKEVIARLDFGAPVRQPDARLPRELHSKVLSRFPMFEPPQQMFSRELVISPTDTAKDEKHKWTNWIFYDAERTKQALFAPEWFHVAYSRYDSYQTLYDDVVELTTALFAAYPELSVTRFGLRYINHLRMEGEDDPLDWDRYINPVLLKRMEVDENGDRLCRVFHNLALRSDGYILVFQYGMHNPDFPAPIRKKLFVLDYDAYSLSPLELREITQNLSKFHAKIESLFERSITDDLRAKMEPESG